MKVFISYSRKDENYKDQLLTHLSTLQRNGIIDAWTDRKIKPGEKWDKSIKKELRECEVVLFLISADFMASEYIHATEVKISLERQEQGKVHIIPIILRPCSWKDVPVLGELQALPKDAEPLDTWTNIDKGWVNVVEGIKTIIQDKVKPTASKQKGKNSNSSKKKKKAKGRKQGGMTINNSGAEIGKQLNIDNVNGLNIN